MEPSTQKLIHTFGALADLGQEIAGTGDFTRDGAHVDAPAAGDACACDVARWSSVPVLVHCSCVALWGLGDQMFEWL